MLNLGIKRVPFLIIAFLISACGFMGISWGPFRAKDVVKIRINLADTSVVNLSFNNIKNIDKGSSNPNSIHMITVSVADENLLQADPKKSILRKKMLDRYNQSKLFHAGEIQLKLKFISGNELDTVLQGYHGDFGMENSIPIGSFTLVNTRISGLTFKINKIDTLLVSELKHPFLWLYYDGGK